MHISFLYPGTKLNKDILGITNNSKKVRNNYIFVATKGFTTTGNKYIKEALDRGAAVIVSNKHKFKSNFIYAKDPKKEYIRLLQIFHGYNRDIYTVGITGTDGKTTTSTLLNSIFNSISSSAYIGTNGVNYLNKKISTLNTTPSSEIIYQCIQTFNKHKINNLVMEVSSEGLLDKRVDGLYFNGAIFTNLSHEHLNSHKNMNSYFLCKTKLFEMLENDGLLVINADDEYSTRITRYTKAKIITYGFEDGDYKIKSYNLDLNGSSFVVTYKGKEIGEFKTSLFGRYNIYNCLAVIAYSYELGIPISIIKDGIHNVDIVDGRFVMYKHNTNTFIIDYAHTPNALESLLTNLRKITNNKIILITGAQGEKDTTKRSKMGQIASKHADVVIFTSEDPKNESLFNIFNDLIKDIKDNDYYLTLSRSDAISLAIRIAQDNAFIVVTGKGNETTEKILDFTFKQNDLDLIKEAIKNIKS
ncbi:MAG: UDP-N-acetylmuramoyl-L-alanyl-D-glutamate--2,6-diaminopimelate ligase [Erysipelotrichaceae bacterium]|nr:UDP-N-acetylmuramoyl-L-alanyl-D-glutamate--2,6-diaminopimelate ligase [Erysipelotrichaceae bacterium]